MAKLQPAVAGVERITLEQAETLSKATKINSRFDILNWGTGFTVSALFLSTFIPKIQYWITRKTTGSNEFPGTKEFREKQQSQKK